MRARTLREGSVGLTVLVGLAAIGAVVVFARGASFRGNRLRFTIFFENANRLTAGAPVRFRGIDVGIIEKLVPVEGGVNAEIVVAPGDISIPLDAEFTANQSGLIGESSVDIYKQGTFLQKPIADRPLNSERSCDSDLPTICAGDRVTGIIGTSLDFLLRDSSRLTGEVTESGLIANISGAAASFETAANELTNLGKELAGVTEVVEGELQTLTAAVDRTSNQIGTVTNQIGTVTERIGTATTRLEELVISLEGVVAENRDEIGAILASVRDTSDRLGTVVAELTPAVENLSTAISGADTEQLVADLEAIATNAAAASEDLRAFAEDINDPANATLLQETLNSARATFANAEKITADLDELTGDPELRRNLRQLVDGLSDLVSSTEALERQLEVARSESGESLTSQ
ncbi:MAG: MlaD family protein [Cyanobacteria bacterium J06641_5]